MPKVGTSMTAWADILLHAKSALTARDGGNAARLPGAIAAATSLWLSNVGSNAEATPIIIMKA